MDLQSIEKDALKELEQSSSLPEVEALFTKYLGRKEGQLTHILRNLGALAPEEKKRVGQAANELRALLEERINSKQKALKEAAIQSEIGSHPIDSTLPGYPYRRGHIHPILDTIREICDIFRQIGFSLVEGPEVETDFNNFTALNIPENHPARDMHDTFYLNDEAADPVTRKPTKLLLRTHTSPVQIRLMQAVKPPIRIIAPGRVYRHEATDATHAAVFHQIEGLVIDKGISFADLKGTLVHFAHRYFGDGKRVRFRPSYFSFVEPGAEMDVSCFLCNGSRRWEGAPCPPCKGSGWLEMLGAGMVHPQVLSNVDYDAEQYTGFAFGMGIERIVMTRYGVRDIRYFLDSDLRFLEQF